MEETDRTRGGAPKWVLPAVSVAAVVLLVIALVVFATRDGSTDDAAVDTSPTAATTMPVDTTTSEAPSTTTDAVETTDEPVTTTSPASTVVESTTPVEPEPAPTFTAESTYFGSVTLNLATTIDGLSVYDGQVSDETPVRCAVVVSPGISSQGLGWNEWCGGVGSPEQFVTGDGRNVWLVELAAEIGNVSVSAVGADWSLPTNGCAAPIGDLLTAADLAPAVMTGVVCVGTEAFVGYSSVFLQPGPPDGGGMLLEQSPDGTWTSNGGGTSYPCEDPVADGIDRCAAFGVTFELFEALLPIPPLAAVPATSDIVGLRDVTIEVRADVGALVDPNAIAEAIAATYRSDDVPGPTIQYFDRLDFWQLELAIIEIPAFDDSIRSTTYVAWINVLDDDPTPPIARVFAFETCARGIDATGLCV